ncbi:AAA family ATPase, partial [Candidatus Micrarchaeota archaeon]|nr:AAA family ATPase [Candidatus Micrarchaeota archaeon]
IYKMAEKENIVVDTHCAIKSPNGYINGLPEWVVKPMSPKIIVLIEGRPTEVVRRRAEDPTRQRADFGGEQDVVEHQDVARAIAASVSGFTGARIKVILNEQGKLDEAARKLRDVLQST